MGEIQGETSLPEASSHAACPQRGGIELAIIVPTFNELGNIGELARRLNECLAGIEWEAIFVDDDSPDGTAAEVRRIAQSNPRVRCLQRLNRRGLSSACIEGFLSSSSPIIAVMDADLQHDETLLAQMLEILRREPVDIVVASRYVDEGATDGWDRKRLRISRLAISISRLILHAELHDPMSGFFMMRREAFETAMRNLSGIGFKILLDLFLSSPKPLRYVELSFKFRDRYSGQTKLDTLVMWEYVMMLADKMFGHVIPIRFLVFIAVGCCGVVVHLLVLTMTYRKLGTSFTVGQITATVVAITSNFLLNNFITYHDRRLRGWQLLRGWISFSVACSIGAVANVGIAAFLFTHDVQWIVSGICGVLISAVWNYAVTSQYTWASKRAG
jgi:dolichol-phosphate mannosyltransferase